MSTHKDNMIVGVLLLTAMLVAGCEDTYSGKPEIKACSDAGGIPIRAWWDTSVLSACEFPPKASNP